jgi:hypothetical protein
MMGFNSAFKGLMKEETNLLRIAKSDVSLAIK